MLPGVSHEAKGLERPAGRGGEDRDLHPLLTRDKSEANHDDDDDDDGEAADGDMMMGSANRFGNRPRSVVRQCLHSMRSKFALGVAVLFTLLIVSGGALFGTKQLDPTAVKNLFTGNSIYNQHGLNEIEQINQKITLITLWNRDKIPTYFRHFFHSAKLNREHIDILLVNRLVEKDDRCLDFGAANIEVPDNVKVVCINHDEWLNRMTGFMCHEKTGWNCDNFYRQKTREYFSKYTDWRNVEWRPLLGYIYRDLAPQNQFWAFIDNDMILGRMDLLPYDVISKFSWVTFLPRTIDKAYMAGQFTIFNYGEKLFPSIWKRIPFFDSPKSFFDNNVLPSYDEKRWSWAYTNPEPGLPGADLSYIYFPDQRGEDDLYTETMLISGRDVLRLEKNMTRVQAEKVLLYSRWLLEDPDTAYEGTSFESAKRDPQKWLRQIDVTKQGEEKGLIVEEQQYTQKCKSPWIPKEYRLCVWDHVLTTKTDFWRSTLLHFKHQKPGKIYRRLDFDRRPRSYSRKLYKHHLVHKRMRWLEFPPMDIDDDKIMLMGRQNITVFAIGEKRKETLFFRDKPVPIAIGNPDDEGDEENDLEDEDDEYGGRRRDD